jgi:hypothetical protein
VIILFPGADYNIDGLGFIKVYGSRYDRPFLRGKNFGLFNQFDKVKYEFLSFRIMF